MSIGTVGDSSANTQGFGGLPSPQMPNGAGAQMPMTGAGEGSPLDGQDPGLGEQGTTPAELDDAAFAQMVRARGGYWSNDDVQKWHGQLQGQINNLTGRNGELEQRYQALDQFAREHLDPDQLDLFMSRWEKETLQPQAQQAAQSRAEIDNIIGDQRNKLVQRGIQMATNAANGQLLFDPRTDRQLSQAGGGYLGWVQQLMTLTPGTPEHNHANEQVSVWHDRYIGRLTTLRDAALVQQYQQGQGQAEQAPQTPPAPGGGRQFTGGGSSSGAGQVSIKEIHRQALAAGQSHEDAFDAALRASFQQR